MGHFMFVAVTLFFGAFADKSDKKLITSELLSASQPEDWRVPSPESLLYLELAGGRVIIEVAPEFAPQHVANIKSLAREKYWDGLAIVRAQDNYVVQWGDPFAEDLKKKKKIAKSKETLPAEFDISLNQGMSATILADKDVYAPEVGFVNGFPFARDAKKQKMWLTHCYGAVGAGRNTAADSGGGAELYVVIGHAPRHLDRNVTVFGRVISGIELLSSLPRGTGVLGFYEKPSQQIKIKSIKVAADVVESQRTPIEVLRTDSPLFAKLIEARRYRQEEWFHYQAGHIDVCNIQVPVRIISPTKK